MNKPNDRLVFSDPYELTGYLERCIAHAEANKVTSERLQDAHDYVQKYCMPEGWNKNVWHTILDDALRMRKERNE